MLWAPNLQLLYPFQNQANDYSGNARHGTVFGSGVYATRPSAGRCLYFDGVGDYVATPSFGLSGAVVVFAAGVRCTQNAAWQIVLGDNTGGAKVGFLSTGRKPAADDLVWGYADGSTAGGNNIYLANYFSAPYENAWLYLVIVCDYVGKKLYVYRQGIPFGSPVTLTGTPVFPTTARVKYIGSYSTTQYFLTDGYLADVQLWTLATMPPDAMMNANVRRMHLGLHPIWGC